MTPQIDEPCRPLRPQLDKALGDGLQVLSATQDAVQKTNSPFGLCAIDAVTGQINTHDSHFAGCFGPTPCAIAGGRPPSATNNSGPRTPRRAFLRIDGQLRLSLQFFGTVYAPL